MEVFTDGSCLNNANSKKGLSRGGIGVYWGENDERNISEALSGEKVTNQVAELTAISRALDVLIKDGYRDVCYIYTDSKYCINIFTEWAKTWEKNDWRRSSGAIENVELIKDIYEKLKKLTIIFKHVKSHQKEPAKDAPGYKTWYGNKQADHLACQASLHALSCRERGAL